MRRKYSNQINDVHTPRVEKEEPVGTDPDVHTIIAFNLGSSISMLESVIIPETYKSTIINFMDKESFSYDEGGIPYQRIKETKNCVFKPPFGNAAPELSGTELDDKYFVDLATKVQVRRRR